MDPAARFTSLINGPAAAAELGLLVALIGAAFDRRADVDAVIAELDDLAARCEPSFEGIMAGLFGSGLLRVTGSSRRSLYASSLTSATASKSRTRSCTTLTSGKSRPTYRCSKWRACDSGP